MHFTGTKSSPSKIWEFGIPNSYNIQICLSRIEVRGQGHSDPEAVGDTLWPKMYPHTKFWTAT